MPANAFAAVSLHPFREFSYGHPQLWADFDSDRACFSSGCIPISNVGCGERLPQGHPWLQIFFVSVSRRSYGYSGRCVEIRMEHRDSFAGSRPPNSNTSNSTARRSPRPLTRLRRARSIPARIIVRARPERELSAEVVPAFGG